MRGGRLQTTKKKRTDRSYLRGGTGTVETGAGAPPEALDADLVDDPAALAEAEAEAEHEPDTALLADGVVAIPAPHPPSSVTPVRPARATGAARAIQQQGVRKRRDIDLAALARRDTNYAVHELRRIAALATMVIVTLIVLGFVLR